MQSIALVDFGMGNLRSVERALLQAAGDAGAPCAVTRTGDPEVIARADKVVVPGQGAFRDCAAALQSGIGEVLREQIRKGTPYLGICLGMQALFDSSEEAEGARGLGVFPGTVKRLTPEPSAAEATAAAGGSWVGIKIPHMGWNRIAITRDVAGPLGVFAGESPFVYFVHSYHAVPRDPALVAATTEHGQHRITAAIERDNVTATQFHPEKSQETGLRLLVRFLDG
ncbi:amidotransferase [Sorangium cellulosum]|uniref:Imidazole glycerol phosphate synthase subunit HisH n=1 Tax=Sorangium cellulosum TaxID=56 RepID=A0A150RRN3_SORCE|nr:amidotransferase [Sorangium cellulosum]KYF94131.1 amidotransferase [Sorangium cellulosum]